MDDDLAAEFRSRKLAAEGRHGGRAGAVAQLEAAAGPLELADHRHDGRDADAAGDEQIASRALDQGEVVGGRRDRELAAGTHVPDHAFGAAAATIRFALDRDDIAIPLGRVVAERIFADEPVGYP